jgi:glycosyltransferase involved in cell wall biosynthesis
MSLDVLHVITDLDRGGAEKQLLFLTQMQKRMGLKVSVLYLKGMAELKQDFTRADVPVYSVSAAILMVAKNSPIKFSRNIQLVHAHLPRAELFARILAMFTGSTFVVTRHNTEAFIPSRPGFLSKSLNQFVTRRADHMIVISNAVRDYLLKIGELDEQANRKTTTVKYGYDFTEYFHTKDKETFSYKIGTASRLTKQKDIPTQFKALHLLKKMNGEDWRLKIAGVGSLEKDLTHLAKNLEIDSVVTWLGRIENMADFYKEIDVFVLSSLYEGLGQVLLEAMCHRVPILATRTTAIPEILGFDYPGLFEVGNAKQLSELLQKCRDLQFRRTLLDCYKERLEDFDPSRMTEKIIKLYAKGKLHRLGNSRCAE